MMTPWNQTGERPYITVLLDNTTPHLRKAFHCVVCGQVTFEYFTDIRFIMAGMPESEQLSHPILHACTRKVNAQGASRTCKTMYVIA
jgi:hypothetical protein